MDGEGIGKGAAAAAAKAAASTAASAVASSDVKGHANGVGTTGEAITAKFKRIPVLQGLSAEEAEIFVQRRDAAKYDVQALFKKHGDAINEVKALCQKEIDENEPAAGIVYDELFVLRYLLSSSRKGNVQKAAEAVRRTIRWRSDNRERLEEIKAGGRAPAHELIVQNT